MQEVRRLPKRLRAASVWPIHEYDEPHATDAAGSWILSDLVNVHTHSVLSGTVRRASNGPEKFLKGLGR